MTVNPHSYQYLPHHLQFMWKNCNVTLSCTLLVPVVTLHHILVNHPIFLFVSLNSCYLQFSIEFYVFFILVFRCHTYLWIIFQILDIANIFFQFVIISEICLLCVSLNKNSKIWYNQIYQFFMKIFFSWRYSSVISSITFTFCFFFFNASTSALLIVACCIPSLSPAKETPSHYNQAFFHKRRA